MSILPECSNEFDIYGDGCASAYIPTGFVDLDWATKGLRKGSIVVIAGRPSLGKTAFAMNIATHVALDQKLPILIFSLQASSVQLTSRLISQVSGVDSHTIRTAKLDDEERSRVGAAMRALDEAEIYIDETPALKVEEISARALEIFQKHGQIGLVVIDSLQDSISLDIDEGSTKSCDRVMRRLRELAQNVTAPVMVLSPLNRRLEYRKDKRPRLSDLPLREIVQHADLLLLLYREEVYWPESPSKGQAEIMVGRNRYGAIGTVYLRFRGEISRFENLR